ncbi:uncharacterized protein [Typha angustifolia]|uniref:uncharacterized protein isoform X2 n=1 Tax=Typha angustifolia TaxID=59011 RepID=UPI003C2E3B62
MPRRSRKNSHRADKRVTRDEREPKFSTLARSSEVKDRIDLDNGGFSTEVGKNWRNGFEESSICEDRWNCGEEDEKTVHFETKDGNLGHVGSNKTLRSKISVVDFKERSRSRGKGVEKEEESTQERSNYVISELGGFEEERAVKKDSEMAEYQQEDELFNTKLEKEHYLHMRRECSEDKYRWQDDNKETEDGQLRFEEVCTEKRTCKGGMFRYGSHNDGRYRGRYTDDIYTVHRHREDRNRQKHSSRDLTTDRSSSNNHRDEYEYSEDQHNKSKLVKTDNGGSYPVEWSSMQRYENRGRKTSYKDNNNYSDLECQDGKRPHGHVEKYKSDTNEYDSHANRGRPEYLCANKVESDWGGNRQTGSPGSSILINTKSRHNLKQEESTQRECPYEERFQSGGTSIGDFTSVSGQYERAHNFRSLDKTKAKDDMIEAASSKYTRTPRLDDLSPFSDRSGMRHSLDLEDLAQRDNFSKDGISFSNIISKQKDLLLDNPVVDHFSRSDLQNSEHILVNQSTNGNSHFSRSSSGHLPPLPISTGVDSPSNIGSYEDDTRIQRNYKFSSHFRRNSDHSNARGEENAFRGALVWPSPIPDCFIPFQHVLLHPGFPSASKQYPTPSPFCIRPPLDINHTGVPYHNHEVVDHFSGYVHPFGWHNQVENPYLELPGWDTSKSVFANDSHAYENSKQDCNRHVVDNQIRNDMRKGHKGHTNLEFDQHLELEYSAGTPADETLLRQSLPQIHRKQRHGEQSEIKRSSEAPPAKIDTDAPPGTSHDQSSEPPTITKDESSCFCYNYLFKLDISKDLASPDLYKKCMAILGSGQPNVSDVLKHEYLQNAKAETKVLRKSSNCILTSLFPPKTAATFQKAMSLYRIHNEFTKSKYPGLSVSSQGGINASKAVDKEEFGKHDNPSLKENGILVSANSTNKEEEGNNINVDVEGDHPGYDQEGEKVCTNSGVDYDVERCQNSNVDGYLPDVAKENSSGSTLEGELSHVSKELGSTRADADRNLSDVAMQQKPGVNVDTLVFLSSSQACETVKPECSVNANQMTCSPESTQFLASAICDILVLVYNGLKEASIDRILVDNRVRELSYQFVPLSCLILLTKSCPDLLQFHMEAMEGDHWLWH